MDGTERGVGGIGSLGGGHNLPRGYLHHTGCVATFSGWIRIATRWIGVIAPPGNRDPRPGATMRRVPRVSRCALLGKTRLLMSPVVPPGRRAG